MYKNCKVVMLPTNKKANIGDFIIINCNGKLDCGIKSQEPYNMSEDRVHLYILSDDEIEVGDWFYDSTWSKEHMRPFSCNSADMKCGNQCYKIIATTNPDIDLPSPSMEFVKKYVKLNGSINEVKVKFYERHYNFNDRICDEYDNNYYETKHILHVNSDSYTISIKKVKNNYTREEVINLLKQLKSEIEHLAIQNFGEKVLNDFIKEQL